MFGITPSSCGLETIQYSSVVLYSPVQCVSSSRAAQSIPQGNARHTVPHIGAADFAAPCSAASFNGVSLLPSGAVDSVVHLVCSEHVSQGTVQSVHKAGQSCSRGINFHQSKKVQRSAGVCHNQPFATSPNCFWRAVQCSVVTRDSYVQCSPQSSATLAESQGSALLAKALRQCNTVNCTGEVHVTFAASVHKSFVKISSKVSGVRTSFAL